MVHFQGRSYLLTPWCRVLPEQLTGLQLVKKFPAFHGTRRFITALTSVRHLSLPYYLTLPICAAEANIYRNTLIKTITHVTTNHSLLNKDANVKTSILTEQYNTWNKSTISRKLMKMDVLTSETCWAINNEIIKQVTSSWYIFIQLSRWCTVQ